MIIFKCGKNDLGNAPDVHEAVKQIKAMKQKAEARGIKLYPQFLRHRVGGDKQAVRTYNKCIKRGII